MSIASSRTSVSPVSPVAPVVLVTGASSGLGRATAELLSASGFRVYGTSRDPARRAPFAFPMVELDVRSDASVAAGVAQVLSDAGRIDALVQCAGDVLVGAVEETGVGEALALMETNYLGVLRLVHAVLPQMLARGEGRIVNVSSLAGVVPAPFLGAYAASKHALEAMTEALAFEVRPHGVDVSLVELDGMRTSLSFGAPARPSPRYGVPRRRMLHRLEQATRETGDEPAVLAEAVHDILRTTSPRLRWIVGKTTAAVIEARRRLSEDEFARTLVEPLGLWAPEAAE